MSKDLYIHLITQFILIKPGRPFEEVQLYAEQIGASEDEIKEAIFEVSTRLADRKLQKKDEESDHRTLSDPFALIDKEEAAKKDIPVPNFLKDTKTIDHKEKLFSGQPLGDSQIDGNKKESAQEQKFDEEVDEVIKDLKQHADSTKPDFIVPGEDRKESPKGNNSQAKLSDEKKDSSHKISAGIKKHHRFGIRHQLAKAHLPKASRNLLVGTFLVPLLVLTGSILTYHVMTNSSQNIKGVHQQNTTADAQANTFGAAVVYANQESVDAKRIFSFPTSDITLKYTSRPQKEVFGFFPYWMLDVQDQVHIDSYTTIAIFGLTADSRGNIIASSGNEVDGGWAMWNNSKLDDFIARARKKKIQVVLTIKSFNNDDIEKLVLSDQAQRKFISNSIQLINLKSLDGINLDFEYVGTPDKEVTAAFTRLVANLNTEMKRQIPESTLTIDTYLKSGGERDLFDIESLEKYVDALVVMGYDVHTPNGTPGAVIPMEGPSSVVGFMQSYLERISPKKLILALPYYGYDWPVKEEDREKDPPKAVPYAEIASYAKTTNIAWDETTQTPSYSYTNPDSGVGRIVHFENPRSLALKYDYINKKNLKGVGIWAMGYEGLNLELDQVLLEKFAK